MNPDPSFEPEEPWERDVAAMLGGLPSVEPPVGFLDQAVDHRPLHSGRIVGVLLALSLFGIGLSLAVGDSAVEPAPVATASQAGDDAGGDRLRAAVPPIESSLLDTAADGVLALARQLGFP